MLFDVQKASSRPSAVPEHTKIASSRGALRPFANSLRSSVRIPNELRRNHRFLTGDQEAELRESLIKHFFSNPDYYPDPPEVYLRRENGQADLQTHIAGQTNRVRCSVAPWIHSVLPLKGARILEIGCGTGASTIPFAEQGSEVTGIDVSEEALAVARDRCRLYGVHAKHICANASQISAIANSGNFDAIIFFAVLEHMTPEERRQSLRLAWDALKPGKLLIIVEAPNRLWYKDIHTSFEPFFFWLPDDLALLYSKYTSRPTYNSLFREPADGRLTQFYRWGRGVSFHDFVIALEIRADELPVVSSLSNYIRRRRRLEWFERFTRSGRYERFLQSLAPRVHHGFMCCGLDLIFQKP